LEIVIATMKHSFPSHDALPVFSPARFELFLNLFVRQSGNPRRRPARRMRRERTVL
jgi:hypothetical protein